MISLFPFSVIQLISQVPKFPSYKMLENCDHKAIDPQASRRVSRARNVSKDSEKLKEKRRKNEDRTRIILFKSWFSHVRIVTSHLMLVTSHVRILKFTEQRKTKRGEERGGEERVGRL